MSSIGRRFDRESSSFSVISPTGGIRPAARKRASQALSLSEREEISRGLSTLCSLRSIARRLGRSPSTISREVRRNGGPDRYRAARSDQAAWGRALRPKLLASLERDLIGFVCGSAAGIALGFGDRVFPPHETLARAGAAGTPPDRSLRLGAPDLDVVRRGEAGKVVFIALAAFQPTLINTWQGVSGIPRSYRELANVLTFGCFDFARSSPFRERCRKSSWAFMPR
ncbi:helix-turn-helix domain-containing protein [Mesorhizobium sp. M1156]|uniref:helix-turn-helix domain-containing protein n=1 Tax=Mesorhizobium sp. M1156 TaxID=2957064 RepID=UPI003335BA48